MIFLVRRLRVLKVTRQTHNMLSTILVHFVMKPQICSQEYYFVDEITHSDDEILVKRITFRANLAGHVFRTVCHLIAFKTVCCHLIGEPIFHAVAPQKIFLCAFASRLLLTQTGLLTLANHRVERKWGSGLPCGPEAQPRWKPVSVLVHDPELVSGIASLRVAQGVRCDP